MLGPLVAALAIAFALCPLEDPDVWFHLAGGRFIWQTGRWPAANTFSFTFPDYPYVDLHWIFQLILYAVYRLAGLNGCIALSAGLVLVMAWLLRGTAARFAPPAVCALLLAVAITIASPRFVPRPELFSFVFLAAYLWLLERVPPGRHIYLLVPLQVLWVNSHALFVTGLVLIGCYWLGATLAFLPLPRRWREASGCSVRDWRRLTAVLALATVACLINPYGVEGLRLPFELFTKVTGGSVFSMRIAELLPPFISGYARPLAWAWAGLLAATGLSFLLNVRHWHLGRLLAAVAFGVLSTQALRNMALFAWIAVPAVAGNVGALLDERTKARLSRPARRRARSPVPSDRRARLAQRAVAATLALLLIAVVTNRFSLSLGIKKQFGLGTSVFVPTGALEFARAAGITGRPFNCLVAGGLMAWQLFPGQRVFVDGRLEAYPETFFTTYFHTIDVPETWPGIASRYGFDYALLEITAVDRWPLARYLAEGHGWVLVYHDETAALFLPSDEAHRAVRDRAERAFAEIETRRFHEPLPEAPGLVRRLLAFPVEEMQLQIGYGDFLRFLGRYAQAAKAYQRALVLVPDSLDVRLALGAAYWYAGSHDEGVAEWREILRRDPGFDAARQALAQASRAAAPPANPIR